MGEKVRLTGDVALDRSGELLARALGLLLQDAVKVGERRYVSRILGLEELLVGDGNGAVDEGLLELGEVFSHLLNHGDDRVGLHGERLALSVLNLEVERVDVGVGARADADDLAAEVAGEGDVLALGIDHDDVGVGVGKGER